MEPSTYSNVNKLANYNFESLLSRERVLVRGPVGFFPLADKSFQFRMLTTDADGYGGIALSLLEHAKLMPKYTDASNEGKTLWVVVQGSIQQYETMDQVNRVTEPDALFVDAEIVAFYKTELHQFPEAPREK